MMNLETGLFEAFDHFQPHRPVRVDQRIDLVSLNQKRCMPDPGYADLALPNLRKFRRRMVPEALDEKRRDQDAGQIISFVPIRTRTQAHARGSLDFCAVNELLANYVSLAFLRKRNRHCEGTI